MIRWLCLLATGCAALSQNSNQSGMSSAASGNSSGQSSNVSNVSSGTSAQSSASSQQSSNSSAQSVNTSGASGQSSNATSSGTSGTPSSTVVAGSALLLAVAGGIITTVYSANQRRAAQRERQELRQLQQAPVPQPMPYKVEPIPLQPGIPGPAAPVPAAPGPFVPAPFPKSSQLEPSFDAMMLARDWLVANELQLKQDLALGAGPAIDDLAGLAGIAPARREHFGRVLQHHRAQLLVAREVTPREAAMVMSRVGDLVMADPQLRADGVAALAAR